MYDKYELAGLDLTPEQKEVIEKFNLGMEQIAYIFADNVKNLSEELENYQNINHLKLNNKNIRRIWSKEKFYD